MPRITEHQYVDVNVRIIPVEIQGTEDNAEKKQGWCLIITDQAEMTQHKVAFDETLRAELLEQLTGGVVPATAADLRALGAPKVVL